MVERVVFSDASRRGAEKRMNQKRAAFHAVGKDGIPNGGDTERPVHYFSLSQKLLIGVVCYAPVINSVLPKTEFGEGIPDLDLVTTLSLFLVPVFFVESLFASQMKINLWLFSVFGFFCIVLGSVSWSPWYTFNLSTVREIVFTCGFPVVIATLGVNLFRNPDFVHKYMRHFVFAAAIMAGICVCQFVLDTSRFGNLTRAAGTLGNPNLVAVFLVLALPIVLYLQGKGNYSMKVSILLESIIFAGIVSTVSRKGLMTAGVVYLIFYIYHRQYRRVIFVLLGIAIAASLAFSFSHTVAQRFEAKELEGQLGGKWSMMMAGIDIYTKNPVIGLGYQGYYESFNKYFPNPWKKKYDAHNEYATVLANYGTLGFLVFMLIFIHPLVWARRFVRRQKQAMNADLSSYQSEMGILAIGSIVPFMMSAFYAGTLFYQTVVVYALYMNVSMMYASRFVIRKVE